MRSINFYTRSLLRACSVLLSSLSKPVAINRFCLWIFTLAIVSVAGALPVGAQWRIATDRDTMRILADNPSQLTSRMQLTSPIVVSMDVSGTFGLWAGQDSTGFDARYTYAIPNWLAPYPLADPPSFNGTNYQIYLAIDTNRLGESPIHVNEPYQTSHKYTSRYVSTGVPFKFRIKDRLNERPDGYYYGTGTGALTLKLARFTAGVALQTEKVEFGTVLIGFAATIPDSIESYGVDALQVDSIRIIGSNDFSVTSQRGDHFTLSTESTNEFIVRFAPSAKQDADADLHIYSHNADGPNRHRIIHLHGIGGAPSIAIGPHRIDFGKVRIGSIATSYTNVYNGGNANLYVYGNPINPIISPFTTQPVITPSTQITVSPTSNWQMRVHFAPTLQQRFAATMFVQAQNVPLDSVQITGEGVQPIPVLSTTNLNFGSVRRGDHTIKSVTLTNNGNLTATILSAGLHGPNASAYQYTPNLTSFLLDPDSSITFSISFAPGTGPEGQRQAWLEFDFDDKSEQIVNLDGYELEPKILLGRNLVDFGKVQVGLPKTDTVSIQNNGNVVLPIGTRPFVLPFTAPFNVTYAAQNLTAFQRDSIQLTFLPTLHGAAAAWMHTVVNGQFDSVYLVGFGALPLPKLSVDTLDFGIHPAGIPATLFTILSDTGDFELRIAHLEITGPDQKDFTLTSASPKSAFRLPEGHDTALAVTFVTNAKTGLLHQAVLTITYTDSTRNRVYLLGREQSQYVQFAQKEIDFGKARVKSKVSRAAVFSNGSNVLLHVGSISISQQGSAFSAGDSVSSVRPQDTSNISISFQPPVRGAFQGYLHARDGDIRPDSVLLLGIGAAPVPVFSAKKVDCGLVPLPGTASKTLTLTNAGDWYLNTTFAIVDDVHKEFSIASGSGSTTSDSIWLGAASNYTITFTPKVPQLLHSANLVFTYDDGSKDTIQLVGRDEYKMLVVDSVAVNFGKVRVFKTATHPVSLINTSSGPLTVQSFSLQPNTPPFSIDASGSITVASRTADPINVSFSPIQRGAFKANIVAFGGDIINDTVALDGIGVAPIAQLGQAVLDFGSLYVGATTAQSTFLKNAGDWDLIVTKVKISGPNSADFDVSSVPLTFTLHPADSIGLASNFIATTPLQSAPRTATLTFTLDDNSTFTLGLTELDKAPDGTEIAFLTLLGRPGDLIHQELHLRTPIAFSAGVHELSGTFTFDTTVAQLLQIDKGGLVMGPNWTLTTTISKLQTIESVRYDLKNSIDVLTNPGVLLNVKMMIASDAKIGSKTDVKHTSFQFFNTNQISPLTISGLIVVDSTCGNTHLEVGKASATFVQQNSPNPIGSTRQTSISFDVGFDNTSVTVRVLDVAGREVIRPIDHRSFAQGRYSVTIDAHDLHNGMYFYEFTAGDQKPEVKKMIVAQ
jgi:hypothetical protein